VRGARGGSYTSLQIADNLPGMFQGIFISCTFPDPDGIAFSGMDGHLLTHYFTADQFRTASAAISRLPFPDMKV